MLDRVHKMTLESVEQGDPNESPALRTLVASGLVEQHSDGLYALSPEGRVALEDDKPERWERIAWPTLGFLAVGYVVVKVVDWVT